MSLKDKRIFISYGHDRYFVIAERLASDLSGYAKSVWFDKNDIRSCDPDWSERIAQGIEDCDVVLALMTKHAYRRPAGICTNEIIYASNKKKTIRTVLVENMEIPFLLCAIQYFDINDVFDAASGQIIENRYQEKFERLVEELESDRVDFKGYLGNVKAFLDPQNNVAEISRRLNGFVGRRWLFNTYEKWVAGNDSSILFVIGQPGSGKSSFCCKLAVDYKDIKGIHFCRYNDKKSGQVASIIKTAAYYLITQISEYAEYFGTLDLQEIANMNPPTMFEELLLKPLAQIKGVNGTVAVVIDAIDEMDDDERALLINLLTENKNALPVWFKLIFTSRPSAELNSRLKIFNPVELDVSCAENESDLREFIASCDKNSSLSPDVVDKIVKNSEGVIQYVRSVMDEFALLGRIDENSLPDGMAGVYKRNFDRIFASSSYSSVRPFLDVICAEKEPVHIDVCEEICGFACVSSAMKALKEYLLIEDGKIRLLHKSLYDWLVSPTVNVEYCASVKNGNKAFCEWITNNAYRWQDEKYLCKYGMEHFYDSRDVGGIISALETGGEAAITSFCELVFRLVCGAPYPDRFALVLLSKIAKSGELSEKIAAKTVKFFVERGEKDRATDVVAETFFACGCAWIKDFTSLCACRFRGDWKTLETLGNNILPQISDPDVLLELYDYMGDAERLTGNRAGAFDFYEKAINGVPEFERAERCFSSLYNYYDLLYVGGRMKEAEENILRYSAQVENDDFKQYKTNRLLGNIRFQRGEKDEARKYFEKTLELAKLTGRQYCVAEALYSIAESLVGVNDEECLQNVEKAREIAKKIGSKHCYAKTYFAAVEGLLDKGDYSAVIKEGEEGIKILKEVNYKTGYLRVQRQTACAYYHLGDYEKAIEYVLPAIDNLKSKNTYPAARLSAYLLLIKASEKAGRLEQFKNYDEPFEIPNLNEFPNAEPMLSQIKQILNK